jgi:flagellar hook-associated protein 3 FlgL
MMRVTEGTGQQQFLTAISSLESSISQTQNDISSNESFTSASQNPVGAGEVNTYSQALAQSQQYAANGSTAQTNLNTEGTALSQIVSQLQSLRSLALEANSGTVAASDRSGIASQMQQIQNSLLALGNTQNGNGDYIFGGYAAQTEPFSQTATGATYNGDQGVTKVQIAADQSVATSDNGDTVFNQIKNGNGTFTVTAGSANSGTGLIGATTVSNAQAYDGGTYQIQFTAAGGGAYNIVNTTTHATVTSGTYTDGSTIAFDGLQIALSGTPAANDTFTVAPSTNQSLFTTVQNLINAVQSGNSSSPALSNAITTQISSLDQALTNISDVQASVGGRLNAITTQQSVQTSQQAQLQTSISSLQGLNYASAITQLDQQNTTLQAALQAYTVTQGLTLFKYIQ